MRKKESAKRVGIWLRVSTEDQVKGENLDHHERRARLYAEDELKLPALAVEAAAFDPSGHYP